MKLTVKWIYGNPTRAEVYLDGKQIKCRKIPDGVMLRPCADGLIGTLEGRFRVKDEIVTRET